MTEAPKRMFIHNSLASCIDESGHDAYPHEYIRKDVSDLARPVTVAEAAKVLLDAAERDANKCVRLLSAQPLGGFAGLKESLRALSHEREE